MAPLLTESNNEMRSRTRVTTRAVRTYQREYGMSHRSCFHIYPLHLLAAAVALLFCSGGAPRAGEQCAAQPGLNAAPGSHWYYRVDRASQRKCWFLAKASMKVRQPAPAKAQSTAKPQSVPDAFDAKGTIRTDWPSSDPPAAAAENTETWQTALVSTSAREPETNAGQDSGAQPQAIAAEEPPRQGPMLAALESPASEPQMQVAVTPTHLLALLAAALTLAALVGRLIFRYSVVFSA